MLYTLYENVKQNRTQSSKYNVLRIQNKAVYHWEGHLEGRKP